MTDMLRPGKALVQPSDPDAPYSDPVTAAPAAAGREEVINRVREDLRAASSLLDEIDLDLTDMNLPDTDWHVGFAMMAVRDALQSLAVRPPIADEER